MKKAGIVDPTKVSRSALQNAVSIASMILTTESLVTDKKKQIVVNVQNTRQQEWTECIRNKNGNF